MQSGALLLLLAAAAVVGAGAAKVGELETVHEWTQLDFDWENPEARDAAVDSSRFVPEYCVLVDVKAVDGEVFVTVPRFRHGVPASVNHVVTRGNNTVLSPYPSWEMNTPGDCENIQNAHTIEIDPLRRMWIVDSGRRDMYTRPNNDCPAKIVVWDMVANREVRRHVFPEHLVSKMVAMIRGVVVDTTAADPEDWFAYVADAGSEQLVVYSWREDASWNVTHQTMKYDGNAFAVQIGKETASFPVAIDSLALSPRRPSPGGNDEARLFFSAVSSFQFYSIRTAFLQNRTDVALAAGPGLDAEIETVGTRSSQSEGMTVSEAGILFYSVLNNNAVNQWNISVPFSALDQVYKDDDRLQWADSFGWDAGYLYITSNKWHKTAMLNFDSTEEVMFRLMRARVDMAGYMGPYRLGQRVAGTGAAPPLVAAAAWTAALLCAAIAAAV